MIFDKLSHRDTYRDMPDLAMVLAYLAEAKTLPEKRVTLRGDNVFVNPVSLVTRPEEDCRYEAHRLYADVHCVLEGREKIRVADIGSARPLDDFDSGSDAGFYDAENGTVFCLEPGDFLVCFPQDAHRVAIAAEGDGQPVKKLVGKIRVTPGE